MRRISVRLKIAIAFFVYAAVLGVIGLSLGYFFGGSLILGLIEQNYDNSVSRISATISENIDEGVNNSQFIADKRIFQQAIALIDPEVSRSYMGSDDKLSQTLEDCNLTVDQILALEKDLREIVISAKGGKIIVDSSGLEKESGLENNESWKKAYYSGKVSVFFETIFPMKEETMAVVAPIYSRRQKIVGVCKTNFDLKKLFTVVKSINTGKTGEALILDKDFKVIFCGREKGVCGDFKQLDDIGELEKNGKNKGIIDPISKNGKKHVVFFRKVTNEYGLDLYLVFSMQQQEFLSPIKEYVLQAVVLGFILMLCFFPAGLLLSRPYIKMLNLFRIAAKKVGKGDLTVRTKVGTNDELSDISDAFNEMVENLEKITSSRDELNKEIERRQQAEFELKEKEKALKKQAKELKNSLKDTEENREMLVSMLEDNNQIRKRLEENFSKLKDAQDALIQTEKLASLGKLVADIAHEVNNPLMIVSGNAQLSLMEDIQNEEVVENLKIIEKECFRARDIIKRLLSFSKPSKGILNSIEVKDLLEESVKLVEHQYSLKNIDFVRKYEEKSTIVEVDVNQMEEVFINLLKNSSESMPEGGVIDLSVSTLDGKVRIIIQDNGCGMSKDVMSKIFDPFFTTKEEGTGLGLSVCHGIIQAHGGSLTFESEQGKGTKAVIDLPKKK